MQKKALCRVIAVSATFSLLAANSVVAAFADPPVGGPPGQVNNPGNGNAGSPPGLGGGLPPGLGGGLPPGLIDNPGLGGGLPPGLVNNPGNGGSPPGLGGGLPPGLVNNPGNAGGLPPGLVNNPAFNNAAFTNNPVVNSLINGGGPLNFTPPGLAQINATQNAQLNSVNVNLSNILNNQNLNNIINSGTGGPGILANQTQNTLNLLSNSNSNPPGPGGYGINGPGHQPNENAEDAPGHGYDAGPGMGPGNGLAYGHWGTPGGGGEDPPGGGGDPPGGGGDPPGGGGDPPGGGGDPPGGGSDPPGGGGGPPGVTPPGGGSTPGGGLPQIIANITSTILDTTLGSEQFTNTFNVPGFLTSNNVPTDQQKWRTISTEDPEHLQLIRLTAGVPDVTVPWTVASNRPQPYAFDNDDQTIILAAPGSVFAASADHTLTVKEGSVVIVNGANPTTVITPMGTATVPAMSSTGVALGRFGDMRVASMTGESPQVLLAYKGNTGNVQIASDTEAKFSVAAIASQGTSDFVAGPDSIPSPVAGLSINKGEIDYANAPYWQRLACCDEMALTEGMRAQIQAVKKQLRESGKSLPDSCAEQQITQYGTPSVHIQPIAFVSPSIDLVPSGEIVSRNLSNVIVREFSNSKSQVSEDGTIEVGRGSTVVEAKQATTVKIGPATVQLAKGTIALFNQVGNVVKVKNLHDSAAHSTRVIIGTQRLELMPGQEALIGDSESAVLRAIRVDNVGRRRVHVVTTGGYSVGTSEFSVLTAIHEDAVLTAIWKRNHHEDRSMRESVLKMAACIYTATATRGLYERLSSSRTF